MPGDFTILIDQKRQLLQVRMSGFFSLDDVARYHRAIDAASAQLSSRPADQRMINDISDMSIQSQDIVAAFRSVMADPKYRARRVAFVVASTLARMQVQRVIGARDVQFFRSVADAEAWLFAPGVQSSSSS